ncbi:MAG: helix-turn-helix domain-containing protein [Prevotella sp.]|nr:helix-turn-helix domain-containing protein [Prevotella sp.]
MQKYCSVQCADKAKSERKKRQREFFNAVWPVIDIQRQEYLTFSKAAVLMGCSRQYIYKLVAQGKLRASRLSNRMALIRRADIEKMLEDNPYNKVLFGSRPRKVIKTANKDKETEEPLTYISGAEVMSVYKVKQSWLYASAKRYQIPMCRIAGKNYYSKQHIEDCLGLSEEVAHITDWLSTKEVFDVFGMAPTAIRAYAYRHSIPTKREFGVTYYSQSHIAELRRTDLLTDERYCTIEDVAARYGLTKANAQHIVKVNNVTKRKVGVRNLLLKADIERVMQERAARGL